MQRLLMTVTVATGVLATAACAPTQVGGMLESPEQVAGAVRPDPGQPQLLGALSGPYLTPEVGQSLDERDRARIAEVLENAPLGEAVKWVNPDTGRVIIVTPRRTFEGGGQPCRQFEINVRDGGEPASGMACRKADGNWVLVG